MKKKALLILLALALLLPAGCGGSKGAGTTDAGGGMNSAASMMPQAPAEAEAPMPAPDEEFGWDSAEAGIPADAGSDGVSGGTEAPAKPVDFSEKIIYSADLTVETLEFDAAVAALDRMAAELGGFIEASNVAGDTRRQPDGTTKVVDRWASYILRVPAGKLQEAIHRAGDLGSVTNSGMNAENVTSLFTDQEARKHSLEVQEERLLDMLGRAEDVDTLIILESRLSEVRYEIESIERQLRNWQNQVDYSTLSVYLREVEKYTPTYPVQRTFGERLGSALSDGWDGFCEVMENVALGLAAALPALALLTVLSGVALAIVFGALRHARRKRAKKAASRPPEDSGTPEA